MSLSISLTGKTSFLNVKSTLRCRPHDLSKTTTLNALGTFAQDLLSWSASHAKPRRNGALSTNNADSEKNVCVENALSKENNQKSNRLNPREDNRQTGEDEAAYVEEWINCLEEACAEHSLGPLIERLFPMTEKQKQTDAHLHSELEAVLQLAVASIKDDAIAININGAIDMVDSLASVCDGDICEANKVLQRLSQPLDINITQPTPQLENKHPEYDQPIEEKAWRCAQQLAQAKGDGLGALLTMQHMNPDAAIKAGPSREAAFIVYLQAGHKLRTIDSEISAIPDNAPNLLLFNPKANQACVAMMAARKILQWHNKTKQCDGNNPSFDDANELTSQERIAYRSWQWGFDENQPDSALDQAVHQLLKIPVWLKHATQRQQEQSEYQRTSDQFKKIIKTETWKLKNAVEEHIEHISAGGAMAKGNAECQGTSDQLVSEIRKMDKTASLPLKDVVEEYFNACGAMAKGHAKRAFNKEKTPFRKINGSIGTDLQHIQRVQENYGTAMRELLEYFFDDLKLRMRGTQDGTELAEKAFIYANLCVWGSHGFPTSFEISENMFPPFLFHAEDFINQCKPQESKVKKEAQAMFGKLRYARFKSLAPGSDFFSLLATIKNDVAKQRLKVDAEKRLKADSEIEEEIKKFETLIQQAELCAVEKDTPLKEISAEALQEHAKTFIATHADGNGNAYSSTDGSELGIDLSIFHHLRNLPVFKVLTGPFAGGTYNRLVSYEISSDESGSQIAFGKTKGADGSAGVGIFAGFYQFSMGALTGILGISTGIGLTGKAEKVTRTLLRASHPDSNDAMVDAYWQAIKKATEAAPVSDKDASDKEVNGKNISHVFLDSLATACFAANDIYLSCEQSQNTQLGVMASANVGMYMGRNTDAGRLSIGPLGRAKAKWMPYWTSRKTEKNGAARTLAEGRGNQLNLEAVTALGIPAPPIGEADALRAKPKESKKLSRSLLNQQHYTHIEWVGSQPLNPIPKKVLRKVQIQRRGYFDDDVLSQLSQSSWADLCGRSELQQFLNKTKQWSDDERVLIEHWQMTDDALQGYQRHLKCQRLLTAQKSTAMTRAEKRKINARLNALSKKIKMLKEDSSTWQPAGIEAYRKTRQDRSLDANFLLVANHKQKEEGMSDRLWLPVEPAAEKLKEYNANAVPQF